jgi:ABC-type dipeptide/oligopeptide/nickel transport system permease subunit
MIAIKSVLHRAWDSDLAYNFRNSPITILAALVSLRISGCAAFAPWIARIIALILTLNLMDSLCRPLGCAGGHEPSAGHADNQGVTCFRRLYGTRVSLLVGLGAVSFSLVLGVSLGLLRVIWAAESTLLLCAWPTFNFPFRRSSRAADQRCSAFAGSQKRMIRSQSMC